MTTSEQRSLPLREAARKLGLAVTTEIAPRSGFLNSAGLRLHFLDWCSAANAASPMLCLHGYAQNAHSWDFVALAHAGARRVIALDQRGHGDSDWAPEGEYTSATAQHDLDETVAALGLKDILLVGLSMGGRNAATFAARRPELIRALVVVDVGPEVAARGVRRIQEFTSQADVLDSFDAFVERTLRYSPHREEWRVRGSLTNSLKQLADGHWTWKYDPALRNPTRWERLGIDPDVLWQEWRQVRCPTLIVRGAESDLFLPEVAAQMVQESHGRARLVEVPAAGHLVPGDNPVAFERELRRFVDEVG